jgi:hypothetical protein
MVFGGTPGSIEDEIRPVLASEFCGSINQLAYLWLDAKVESFALGASRCATRILFPESSIPKRNDFVFTQKAGTSSHSP